MDLLPREPYFFEAFASMTRELQRGAKLLLEMVETHPPKLELVPEIHAVEHACDEITHEIITKLNVTFVTPIDREDIHALVTALDDVMDSIDDASNAMPLHRVTNARRGAAELAAVIVAQVGQLASAAGDMTAMGPGMVDAIREIKRLEQEADVLHKVAVAELFDDERDPIEIIKWEEIFDFLEEAADRAEEAAHVIESIYVKR